MWENIIPGLKTCVLKVRWENTIVVFTHLSKYIALISIFSRLYEYNGDVIKRSLSIPPTRVTIIALHKRAFYAVKNNLKWLLIIDL